MNGGASRPWNPAVPVDAWALAVVDETYRRSAVRTLTGFDMQAGLAAALKAGAGCDDETAQSWATRVLRHWATAGGRRVTPETVIAARKALGGPIHVIPTDGPTVKRRPRAEVLARIAQERAQAAADLDRDAAADALLKSHGISYGTRSWTAK